MGLGPSGKAMAEMVVAAPAPGSLNTAGLVEGAGDGAGCLPSPDKAQAPVGKGVNRFFCDVHRRARNGEGYRITFSVDGITFKHVDGFGDIPAKSGDKIYIDTLPLNHTDGADRASKTWCGALLPTAVNAGREEAWGTQAAKNDQRRHQDINGSRGTMVQETLRRLPDNETYDFDVSWYAENSSKTAKHR
jgi:hypothetical protein